MVHSGLGPPTRDQRRSVHESLLVRHLTGSQASDTKLWQKNGDIRNVRYLRYVTPVLPVS